VHIAIGSDQAGHAAKERIAAKLVEAGHEVTDANSAVQPHGRADYAEQVAMLVLRHNAERGIIVTSRVVGASVAANRIPGIRAASCHDAYSASVGAKAEGMNVLVLAVHLLEQDLAQEVVDAYLGATLAPVEVVGGLPPRRLQRVFAHVRENIAQELAVGPQSQAFDWLKQVGADWEVQGDVINARIESEWAALPMAEVRKRFATLPGELRGYLTVVPEARWLKDSAHLKSLLGNTTEHYGDHMADLQAILAAAGR